MSNQNNFAAKIENATLADAIEWQASSEKAMFACEFLGAFSINQIASPHRWEGELEDRFEKLLADA